MKHFAYATIVLLGLTVSCMPTATPQVQIALATATLQAMPATATAMPTSTPAPTQTVSPTAMPTFTWTPIVTRSPSPTPLIPTVTPLPKPTATPEILPLPLSVVKNIDVNAIPPELFGKNNVVKDIGGGYVVSNAGVIGEQTVMKRLPEYPGFVGAVVYVKVDSPSPKIDNQRPYVVHENLSMIEGPWAYEVSHLVLKAPSRLVHSGWRDDPIVMIAGMSMHLPHIKFRAPGGVRLLTTNGRDYYVSLYRVNNDGTNTSSDRKIPFSLGVKQRFRLELFYDEENYGVPSIRAFLMHPDADKPRYEFIGKLPLDSDFGDRLFGGDITRLGIYVGRLVTGFEGVSGEAKIYR